MKKETFRPVVLAVCLLSGALGQTLAIHAKHVSGTKQPISISKLVSKGFWTKTVYLADGGPGSKPCPGC